MIDRRMKALGVIACTLVAVSCDEPPTSTELDTTGLTVSVDAGTYGKANGGGQYAIMLSSGDVLSARFSMSGLQTSPDGETAKGQFHHVVDFFGQKVDFKGEVTCLAIDAENGRAWVGGVVTQNRSEAEPFASGEIYQTGRDIWFRVLDSGEGNQTHGRTTFVGFEGGAGIITSAEYCDLAIWPEGDARTWPVEGNVQVLP